MSLEDIGQKIAELQLRIPWMFLSILLIILLIIGPGIFFLVDNIEPSLEKILPQGIEEVNTMNNMRGQFGADMMYIVITNDDVVDDIRDPAVLTYIHLLSEKLRSDDFILEVMDISDIIRENNNNVIPNSLSSVKEIFNIDPRTDLFINYDHTLTFIQIRSDTGADAKTINNVVYQIESDINSLESYNPGVNLQITGFNAIDKATFEVIIQDFVYITGFSFLFMTSFLFLYFKNWRKVASSLFVIFVSLIITLGIAGYLKIKITVVTMVAAAMIMALGISYGINVTFDYYIKRKTKSKKKSLIELNRELIRALIGSSFTTSAGFLALLFGVIPAMKNLGIVLAIGITVTLFASILVLPIVVYKLDNT